MAFAEIYTISIQAELQYGITLSQRFDSDTEFCLLIHFPSFSQALQDYEEQKNNYWQQPCDSLYAC